MLPESKLLFLFGCNHIRHTTCHTRKIPFSLYYYYTIYYYTISWYISILLLLYTTIILLAGMLYTTIITLTGMHHGCTISLQYFVNPFIFCPRCPYTPATCGIICFTIVYSVLCIFSLSPPPYGWSVFIQQYLTLQACVYLHHMLVYR